MSESSQHDRVLLSDLFRIQTGSCNPKTQPDRVFRYFSIPALDSLGGPDYVPGAQIESNKTALSSPAVLVSKLNPRKPRVALFAEPDDIPTCCSTEFMAYTPVADANLDFFRWYFNSEEFQRRLERVATGSTNSHVRVHPSETLDWRVFSPPDGEQTSIATVLECIEDVVEQTESSIAKLQKIKTGLLHDLLTRGIDENGELRDPRRHPEHFHEAPGFGLVPKSWEILPLFTLIEAFESGVSVNSYDRNRRSSEVGILKTSCVNGGVFDPTEHKAVLGKETKRVHCPPRADSIIISRMNTPLLVGESAYVAQDYPCLFLPDRLWQTTMNPARKTSVRWLSFVLRYEPVRQRISDAATGTSGSMKNISQEKFLAISIRVPGEREQQYIATICDSFDARIFEEQRALAKLLRVKSGLMQDLLSGRKRVPTELIGDRTKEQTGDGPQREANIYFRRAVLAAEIVQQFHELPTFGSVKFQKALFLCERAAGLDLETRYHRAAAGPHDNRLMRSVDSQLERQRWFRKVPREQGTNGNPTGWRYEAMENAGGHRQYFDQYWAEVNDRIQRVLDVLRQLNSERCEIVATLYSAWEDLLAAGDPPTDDAIVDEVLTNWHESKQAISRDRWMAALGWIREQGLSPAS